MAIQFPINAVGPGEVVNVYVTWSDSVIGKSYPSVYLRAVNPSGNFVGWEMMNEDGKRCTFVPFNMVREIRWERVRR